MWHIKQVILSREINNNTINNIILNHHIGIQCVNLIVMKNSKFLLNSCYKELQIDTKNVVTYSINKRQYVYYAVNNFE